ncbi:MAG: PhoD-like phosphatase [Cyanobacteria bacterium P01_G01_bin.19]
MTLLPSAIDYLPDISDLPLILAGPILRRTESKKVTVWLALKEARSLSLKIYATRHSGEKIEEILLQGQRQTIRLGKNLHLVAITATPVGESFLEPDNIYAYDVCCSLSRDQTESILVNEGVEPYSLSYFDHQLPTFCLPAKDLNRLKIVHGSCRKPHGGGIDSLSYLDNMLQESVNILDSRPQQVFFTGDQIYGDDVADPILWLAQGVNQLLFGWEEELPLSSGAIAAKDLAPGRRTETARVEAGLTAMLADSPEKAKSHLFSFGEYAAVYLLSWSPVLMSSGFPRGKNIFNDKQASRNWEREIYDTNSFIQDLGCVRRALANIAVYTICDDHDVSDDWYLNREWCDRVLGKPLGKRVVQNGILAYALFQAWGNTPDWFEAGTDGEKLLHLSCQWLASEGKNSQVKAECDRYLGIPKADELTGLPNLTKDGGVLVLARDSRAIDWHYTIEGSSHKVVVLDTRTWRGYPPGEDEKLEPPMLLSPSAFERQLQIPLSNSKPEIEATFVILPTNLVALGIIDRVQQFELNRDRVFNHDVGDAWNFHVEAFAQLLLNLCQQRDRVIILSGDIHYSCAVRLTHWFHDSLETSVLVQLTSSAIKNSELATRVVHTKLKSLFPEVTERWLGWNQPLKVEKVSNKFWRRNKPPSQLHPSLPDWQYRIEWCKRQPAELLPWKQTRRQPRHKDNRWRRLLTRFISWLWRNPWIQEGSEVVGRNNLSLVRFQWSSKKSVIQETYWHPPWNDTGTVKSAYQVSLEPDTLAPFPKSRERRSNIV